MSDDHLSQLLSAYCDGECTAEEWAFVEQQLANSSELRQQLEGYQQLRMQLRSLPSPAAPTDLHAEILASLSTGRPVEEPVPSPLQPDHAPAVRTRAWTRLATMAMSLSVVGLLTTVMLQTRQADRQVAGQATPSVDMASRAESMVSTWDRATDSPLASESTELAMAREMHAPAPAVARDVAVSPQFAPVGDSFFDRAELRSRLLGSGERPEPGELLSYIETLNEQPHIINYSVVDVAQAAGNVEVLLERVGIRRLGSNDDYVSTNAEPAAPRTVAFYFEADSSQVDQLFEHIPVALVDDTITFQVADAEDLTANANGRAETKEDPASTVFNFSAGDHADEPAPERAQTEERQHVANEGVNKFVEDSSFQFKLADGEALQQRLNRLEADRDPHAEQHRFIDAVTLMQVPKDLSAQTQGDTFNSQFYGDQHSLDALGVFSLPATYRFDEQTLRPPSPPLPRELNSETAPERVSVLLIITDDE